MRRHAFTVMELMIAIAIMALLAGIITVSFNSVRTRSRDGRRKSDLQVYSTALEQYHAVNGTYQVQYASTIAGIDTVSSGKGQGFGLLNFEGGITAGGAHYPSTLTIASALKQGGFLLNIATDPFNTSVPNTTPGGGKPDKADYVLVLCTTNGDQATGSNNVAFALWTKLENAPQSLDLENTVRYCGGSWTSRVSTVGPFVMGYSQPPANTGPITGPDPDPAQKGATPASSYEATNYYFAVGNSKF